MIKGCEFSSQLKYITGQSLDCRRQTVVLIHQAAPINGGSFSVGAKATKKNTEGIYRHIVCKQVSPLPLKHLPKSECGIF